MSRIVSVWLPAWPIDRLRRQMPCGIPEDEPLALVDSGPHGLRISAANAAAQAAGVAVGSALTDARAAVPSLRVRPAMPRRDAEALVALARWLGRYGPASNVDGADGAWVDVTGVPHLFGGERQLCADLVGRLRRMGIRSEVGLADTAGAAHALARFGNSQEAEPGRIAAPGEVRPALAGLPVAALRLAAEDVRLLVRLGLKRIGQLYGLPRGALAARFREVVRPGGRGTADRAAAHLLLRLDQALGLVAEPGRPLTPPPEALSRLAFPEPLLTAEGVVAALARLADDLAGRLAAQGLGGRRFRLVFYRADGTTAALTAGTSRAVRDPGHVCRLLGERLPGIDAGFGIDVATLEAGALEALEDCQTGLEQGSDHRAGEAELVDRLVGRLGAGRVRLWGAEASHLPERAEAWRPAFSAIPHEAAMGEDGGDDDGATHSGTRAEAVPSRPPLLLAPPEPITVIAEIPDGAPQQFLWRRLRRRVVRCEGPERIAPEWWRSIGRASTGTRDYYRLEDTTGARYWVFREGLYGRGEETGDGEETGGKEGFGRDTCESTGNGSRTRPGPETSAETTIKTVAMASNRLAGLPRWFVHGLFA